MSKFRVVYPYIRNVAVYCRLHNLLSPGKLVVAVSGGADSLTLLHMLSQLRDEFKINLHIATLDHSIRGEAGAADVAFVMNIAVQWNLPVTAERVDVPAYAQQNNLGIEEAARKLRYEFLAKVATAIGATTIAVGHNQNDQAETVLMHLLRGTGLKGLRGMLPKTELDNKLYIVRPLLELSRTYIDEYVKAVGLTPRTDETNSDTLYHRNKIRHDIIPYLQRHGYPHVQSVLTRLAEIAREDYDALQACLPNLNIDEATQSLSISRQKFVSLLPGQQRTLIRHAIDQLTQGANWELNFASIESTRKSLLRYKKSRQIKLGRVIVSMDEENLFFGTLLIAPTPYEADCPLLPQDSTIVVITPGIYEVPDSKWMLRVEQIPHILGIRITESIPYAVIVAVPEGASIQFRTRITGDRFKPHGIAGKSQKLQDTFVNIGVPAAIRDQVSLLVINDVIAWFVAPTKSDIRSRIAEPFAVQPDESRLLWRFTFYKPDNDVY